MATLDITITITTPQGVTIADAVSLFARHYGYQETVTTEGGLQIDNPESKAQFSKRSLARIVKEAILSQKKQDAMMVASDNVLDNITVG